MNLNVDNPATDPAEVDKFYTDDSPPIRGIVKVVVNLHIYVSVDAENLPNDRPSDRPIQTEEDAIDYAIALADEYATHALQRHIYFLKPGSPQADLDPDVSGIKIDDATEFVAH